VRSRNSCIWENGERVSYSNCSIFNGTRVEVILIAKGLGGKEFWSDIFADMRVGMRDEWQGSM
jgi:hypothetical protein